MKHNIKLAIAGSFLLALATSGPVNAADGAALFKSKTCNACHGKDAKSPIMPSYPRLAGQNADYALQQMKDIKSGARSNGQTASMKGVMHLVNDEEMKAIATWLASQKP
jgi:cytochrome c